MSNKIEITDLLNPVLSDAVKGGLAYAAANPIDLSIEAILGKARKDTGLTDFGPDDFRPRLARLVDEWNGDTRMTALNRMILFDVASRHAANRLLIQDYVKKHPDVHDEVIERPIIVVGLPRSGTTHLLNLLAADSRLRSLPMWEGNEPLPNPLKPIGPDGIDPRYTRAVAEHEAAMASSPLTAAMHLVGPDDFDEDLFLMCPDFATYFWEWMSRVPKWRDFHTSTDQTSHYEYQRTVLKILQHKKGPVRWVNKCPQHLEQLPVLKKVYPDAIVVMTYRDPVDAIQSAATMMAYAERARYPDIDARWVFDYWADRVEQLLRASVRDRDVWPEDQRVDVPFEALMKDEMAFVHAVQRKAGLPPSDKADAEIRHFVETHPRGKHGQVSYNIERDFGVSRDELRKRFAFYFDAFPAIEAARNG
ncbi:sulfotransferase family protein [Sphingomonas crocodyli]|uniref:Sulfotransferase n=1 Tax=Sphingomonas crocodyli TaxID=1979270 RepID=A0A437M7I6_9SPHN|nr:sulfotransferase [Sphingomonas crocodyli]RVT93573.1 sulfotransferase [Sphingomonas crocodyli]